MSDQLDDGLIGLFMIGKGIVAFALGFPVVGFVLLLFGMLPLVFGGSRTRL